MKEKLSSWAQLNQQIEVIVCLERCESFANERVIDQVNSEGLLTLDSIQISSVSNDILSDSLQPV